MNKNELLRIVGDFYIKHRGYKSHNSIMNRHNTETREYLEKDPETWDTDMIQRITTFYINYKYVSYENGVALHEPKVVGDEDVIKLLKENL